MVYFKSMSTKITIHNLTGKFLVAVPGLDDLIFRQTVILICEHTKEGAFGIIVNKILMNSFRSLLNVFEIHGSAIDMPVFYGGPVKPEQGYVLYSPIDEKHDSIRVTDDIAVTASKKILYDIVEGIGPKEYLFALGFSGWDADQLEEELMTDSWIVVPLDGTIIFEIPVSERWRHAVRSAGVEPDRYISRGGSA